MNEEELAGSRDIHLMLGLSDTSSLDEVKRAYAQMLRALYSSDLAKTKLGLERLKQVRQRIHSALDHLTDLYKQDLHKMEIEGNWRDQHSQPNTSEASEWIRPKIGQVLVSAGLLTLDQLDAALEIQRNTKSHHIFIGQILVAAGYITNKQLKYYLRNQEIMRLPPDHDDRWGQRLVELGLVTDDQLKVALIDQQNKSMTLRQALIDRGWLTAEILDQIF